MSDDGRAGEIHAGRQSKTVSQSKQKRGLPMKRDVKAEAVGEDTTTAVAPAPLEETAPPLPAEEETAALDAASRAEAARARAAQFMAERRYSEARKALEEADSIEAPADASDAASGKKLPHRVLTAVRSQLQRKPRRAASSGENGHSPAAAPPEAPGVVPPDLVAGTAERAIKIVNLYAKIAGIVGLVPGGLLNFAAILAVQVTMVWRISNTFGHRQGKERIRGTILSLLGSAVPTGIGGGMALAVASIPA